MARSQTTDSKEHDLFFVFVFFQSSVSAYSQLNLKPASLETESEISLVYSALCWTTSMCGTGLSMRTGQKFDYFEVSLIYDCELKNNLKKKII